MLISRRDKEDFDRRHRARNLPPLQPETYAWLKYDSLTDTKASAPAAGPRSNIVEGEGSRTFRRNRRDIIAVPSEDEAVQREGDRHISSMFLILCSLSVLVSTVYVSF